MKTLKQLLSYTEVSGDCLLWTRCLNTDGYPRLFWNGSSNGKGHRIVYQLSHPEEDITGLVIRHSCDNPKCINPDHLVSGTNLDNVSDRVARKRSYRTMKLWQYNVAKALLDRGLPQKDIAEIVKLNPRRVSDIKQNKYDSLLSGG